MKIIHFSDIHSGGLAEDWMAYIDKRWVGVFNYRFRRKFQHDLSKLEKAVGYILDVKPGLVVCTGDLTSTGQPGEFEKTLEILAKLRDADIPMITVPGNHDCYVKREKCVSAMKSAIKYLNKGLMDFDDMPVEKDIGDLKFIIVNESRPTNLISSCGYLDGKSSEFIKKICESDCNVPKVLVGHYPLYEDHPLLRIRHRLWGQKEVLELLENKKLDLSLCGHVHVPGARLDESGRGEICAGSVTRCGCMAEIDYDPVKNIFSYSRINLSNPD